MTGARSQSFNWIESQHLRRGPEIRCDPAELLCFAAYCRATSLYPAGDGEGDGDGDASASLFFLVEVFLVVVAAFFVVVSFFAPVSFFVVAAVELDVVSDVVVMDSFLAAHEVIKPATARTAMDVISDFFIRCG